MFGISSRTAVDWYQFCRNICSWALMQLQLCDQTLGGPGKVIQIDETVISKRKFNVGRLVPEKWVFGLYDSETRLGFLQFLSSTDHETLMPIICQKIKPGTAVWSDQWGAYNWIANRPPFPSAWTHSTVNHQRIFVDPNTGTTTNHFEAMWKRAKSSLKSMNGTMEDWIPAHLIEFLWRQRFG